MRRALFVLAAVSLLAGLSGCRAPHGQCMTGLINGSCENAPENCGGCTACCDPCPQMVYPEDPRGVSPALRGSLGVCRLWGRCKGSARGPSTGAITYPYYTVRGPRDFLAADPRSIGP